jgi:hypothetical protein
MLQCPFSGVPSGDDRRDDLRDIFLNLQTGALNVKKLHILGTGCAKCGALAMATERARRRSAPYELEKGHRPEPHHVFRRDDDARAGRGRQGKGDGKVPSVGEIKKMPA